MKREEPIRRKPAMTLLELLIVFIIIGILLSFAMPTFQNASERQRSKNAEFNLTVLYHAQKRHRMTSVPPVYYTCEDCELDDINEILGLSIIDDYFSYEITDDTEGGFVAIATRLGSGRCADDTMSLTQGSSAVDKSVDNGGCSVW